MLKTFQARLQQYMNCEHPEVQLDLEKAKKPEIKLSTSIGSLKKQESSRKISISVLLTMPKPLTVWITINYGKFLRDENTRPPDLPFRKLYAGQEATVRSGHGTTDWLQIGKGVHKVVYCHCAYLTYMQSTS